MEFREYVGFFARFWVLLLFVPAAALIATYLWSRQLTPIYESTAQVLLVNQVQSGTPTPGALTPPVNDILVDEGLIQTYVKLIKHRPVLSAVLDQLSLSITEEELADHISVANDLQTQIIRISARDSDPALAAQIANATATTFIKQTESEIGRPGTILITERAVPTATPAEPNLHLNLVLAGVVSIFVSVALGLVLNYFDTTARGP